MKKAFLVLFSLFSVLSFSQRINDYEYVIVPTKFDFQNEPDEYELNGLLKCQLDEYGFKAYYDTDLVNLNPEDRCLFLTAKVVSVSNIFLFKLLIEFRDCNNAVVMQTETGGSKEKNRFYAFTEALEGTLKSPNLVKYKFTGTPKEISFIQKSDEIAAVVEKKVVSKENSGSNVVDPKVNPTKAFATKLDQNVAVQSKPKQKNSTVSKTPAGDKKNTNTAVVNSIDDKIKPVEVALTNQNSSKEDLKTTLVEPVQEEVVENTAVKQETPKKRVLYAQPIEKGYQLIDTTPKVIMNILSTLQPNYYTANVDKKFGAVFMKNNEWVFEYYTEGNLVTEALIIKFCD